MASMILINQADYSSHQMKMQIRRVENGLDIKLTTLFLSVSFEELCSITTLLRLWRLLSLNIFKELNKIMVLLEECRDEFGA